MKNVFHDTLGKHVVSKHHFFNETWSPRAPLGFKKSSKTIGGVSKNEVFGFPLKVALGRGLGAPCGRAFGPKLGPSWVHVGT